MPRKQKNETYGSRLEREVIQAARAIIQLGATPTTSSLAEYLNDRYQPPCSMRNLKVRIWRAIRNLYNEGIFEIQLDKNNATAPPHYIITKIQA